MMMNQAKFGHQAAVGPMKHRFKGQAQVLRRYVVKTWLG